MKRTRIVGLTGGIATGKSQVSAAFARLGAAVIDADAAARRVVEPGTEGLRAVVACFGEGVLRSDGTLDRKALGRMVFADPEQRRRLESILHPRIFEHMQKQLSAVLRTGVPVVILDIPLLYETGLFLDEIDESVVVYAAPHVQLRRLMDRDGLSEAEALQRIRAQMPLELKVRRAEHVIDNSGPWEQTERQIRALWKEWTGDENCADRSR